jgi:hypothetical protein
MKTDLPNHFLKKHHQPPKILSTQKKYNSWIFFISKIKEKRAKTKTKFTLTAPIKLVQNSKKIEWKQQ